MDTPCPGKGIIVRIAEPQIFSPAQTHTGACSLTIAEMQTSGQTGTKMTRDWRQWEGQVVNGTFPLRQYLGGSELNAVFVTERRRAEPQKAAIKLIVADQVNSEIQLSRWESAAKLIHPHLLRLFETGRCNLGNVALLYIVMEYADETLAQILPHRALTPVEAREMLEPTLDTLAYIHGKSFVHGRLKPANIMAVRDQLKLSSDSLIGIADPIHSVAKLTAYDAPEIANGKISPASDSWSLGMTLMESLTQRLPTGGGIVEPVLETVPAPFMGIAHCCLRRDPQRRCTAADIAAKLRSPSLTLHEQAKTKSATATPKWRYGLPIAIMILAAVVLLFGPKLFNRAPEDQSQSRESSEATSESQNAPAKSGSASPTTETKPSARRPGNANQKSNISTPPVESASTVPEAYPAANQGDVVQQILPSVSKSARDTIHGTIKVRVKVAVDPSGNVERATFVTPGPSKYFARQAMQAAQQWRFAPSQANGQETSRSWIVRFGFKRSGTEAALEQAKP